MQWLLCRANCVKCDFKTYFQEILSQPVDLAGKVRYKLRDYLISFPILYTKHNMDTYLDLDLLCWCLACYAALRPSVHGDLHLPAHHVGQDEGSEGCGCSS